VEATAWLLNPPFFLPEIGLSSLPFANICGIDLKGGKSPTSFYPDQQLAIFI